MQWDISKQRSKCLKEYDKEHTLVYMLPIIQEPIWIGYVDPAYTTERNLVPLQVILSEHNYTS